MSRSRFTDSNPRARRLSTTVALHPCSFMGLPVSSTLVNLMKTRTLVALVALLLFLGVRTPAATTTFPVDELKAGMVGIGRTVFQGDRLEEFKVHILGVLRNVVGTRRNLIL